MLKNGHLKYYNTVTLEIGCFSLIRVVVLAVWCCLMTSLILQSQFFMYSYRNLFLAISQIGHILSQMPQTNKPVSLCQGPRSSVCSVCLQHSPRVSSSISDFTFVNTETHSNELEVWAPGFLKIFRSVHAALGMCTAVCMYIIFAF